MSKFRIPVAVASAAVLAALSPTALPSAALAQQANGVTNCDAPGGRQRAGALIGALAGGVAGSQISRNERTLGAVAGAAAGAAAGSYIGCEQQRARADAQVQASIVRPTTTVRVRSGPGTNYRQVGTVTRGQALEAVGSEGEWVQISTGGWINAHYLTY